MKNFIFCAVWCNNYRRSTAGFSTDIIQYEAIDNGAYTHIRPYHIFDFIFTNQLKIVLDSGVHLSLHPKCDSQIIYSKLNLKNQYPLPYTRENWDYKKAETDLINRSIENDD